MNTIVSVIVTTHNRLSFLEEAINSVVNQSFKNYEIIVVNDHKETDKSVKNVLGVYGNIKLIENYSNPGANFSRNIGIKQSLGEYIAFLDDDDIWDKEYLEKQMANIYNNNLDLSYTGYVEYWDTNPPVEIPISATPVPNDLVNKMASGNFCPETTSAVVVKKCALESVDGFDTELNSFQDWDLWFRLAKLYKFGCENEPLIKFRQHMGVRTSVDYSRRISGLEQINSKWGHEITKDFKSKFLLGCYYSNAKKFAMFGYLKECFKVLISKREFYCTKTGILMATEVLYKLMKYKI